jgi:hypothetical protein
MDPYLYRKNYTEKNREKINLRQKNYMHQYRRKKEQAARLKDMWFHINRMEIEILEKLEQARSISINPLKTN